MDYRFEIEVFFFNAKTDYLPYFKRFDITLEHDAPSRSLLEAIRERNENFAFPDEKLLFRLNEKVCDGTESIGEIARVLGTTLRLEPVQTYRSNHCLIINDDDFKESYRLLESFCDEEDKAFYEAHYALHYASATFDYEKSYAGDAIIALAYHLAKKYPERKEEIVRAVKEPLYMCEYENMLFREYDLQPALDMLRSQTLQIENPLKRLFARFGGTSHGIAVSKVSLHGKSVALYGTDDENIVAKLSAKAERFVPFSKALRRNGRSIFRYAPELALKKAATVLLDAFDSGAEVLVCADEADARYYIENLKAIERIAGRDIPLLITSLSALESQKAAA
jgi:hypothetical protein